MTDDKRPERAAHRRALSYIDASREFYAAHGYETPYAWAVHDDAPFARLDRPLGEATVAVVTTSFPRRDADSPARSASDSPAKAVYARPSQPVPNAMFTDDLSWHKTATHTDDVGTFLPLAALHRAADAGTIGAVGPRFFGVPTEYSQRRTGLDAEQIVAWCREDEVDAVGLVPI